eukprot:2361069-Lingulodinium_polyedra.AAC.1
MMRNKPMPPLPWPCSVQLLMHSCSFWYYSMPAQMHSPGTYEHAETDACSWPGAATTACHKHQDEE